MFFFFCFWFVWGGGGPAAAVLAQNLPSYEPQQRLRTALDTCLKTEFMRGAYCMQKCDAGFRLDASGARPRCVGLSPGAKHQPKQPSYRPPPSGSSNAPRVPGA